MSEAVEAGHMTKYQFQIDDEKWDAWKRTVPRDKSLETRIIELIEADTEGRVVEGNPDGPDGDGTDAPEPAETPLGSDPTVPSDTRAGDTSAPSGDESVPPVARDDVDSDLEVAYREYLADRPPKKSHAKDIVVDALLLLREHGELETGDLQDELFSKYEEHYSTDRTMWNAISRYLKDLAGFEKTDSYGGWAYAGDGAVWETITDD